MYGMVPAEVALDYSYLRSNASPGGCGCINLHGGSATVACLLNLGGNFVLVGDITAATRAISPVPA
jgi:hypothetical protein